MLVVERVNVTIVAAARDAKICYLLVVDAKPEKPSHITSTHSIPLYLLLWITASDMGCRIPLNVLHRISFLSVYFVHIQYKCLKTFSLSKGYPSGKSFYEERIIWCYSFMHFLK